MSQKITSDITDESNTVFNNCVVLPVQEVKVFCLHSFYVNYVIYYASALFGVHACCQLSGCPCMHASQMFVLIFR